MRNTRIKILIAIGTIMLVGFLLVGFFVFPIGISLCSIISFLYGIKSKDRLFTKWSIVTLIIGIAYIIYTLFVIKSM